MEGSLALVNSGSIRGGDVLEGDVNGDGKADFSIQIDDPAHSRALTSADFIL